MVKVSSIREVVLGAPLRVILKQLGSRVVASDINRLVALVHRPKELFFLVPQVENHSASAFTIWDNIDPYFDLNRSLFV